ncbi:MAG: glycosyltransferase family 9 protein [Sedimentisphaerales bacterium]|nr:glycosyltransferase family 9 protein [Sedimentisphaerales bacterium]
MSYNFANILIIKPSAIGDIVMSLPALAALRKGFPDAKITWLVRSEYAPLLRNHPDLNEIILFDRTLLAKWWRSSQSFKALCVLLGQLRGEHFDAAIDLQGLLRTGLFGWISGAKHRFGMKGAREGASLFYNHKITHDLCCVHVVDFYLKIVEAATGQPSFAEFSVPRDEYAEDAVRRLLGESRVADNNYIVMIPGASDPEKCWPAKNFAALADTFRSQFDAAIILAGSEGDRRFTAAIKAATAIPLIDLAGKTTIPELIALLRNARMVISNDTGPGHIAGAMGVPLAILFGPTNPRRLCPHRRPETVVTADRDFTPLEIYNSNPKHSIARISVDEVYKKIIEQMSSESFNSSSCH